MMIERKNIYDQVPRVLPTELMEDLFGNDNCRIERIVSDGHASPEDFWYDQAESEFVLLLQGGAILQFENKVEMLTLRPGDYLTIPAHCRHRVHWTDPKLKTIWVTIFA